MLQDRIIVSGALGAILACPFPQVGWRRDPRSGLYVQKSINHNIITLAGLSMAAKSIQYGNADAGKTLRYLGVGTGYTVPAKTDVALVSETIRGAIDSWDNTDIASDPVVMIASKLFSTSEGNADLMEGALFQESTGAPMYCRGLFGYAAITNATQASPCVITSTDHGLTDGMKILIESVGGMTELNGNAYYIDQLTTSTFGLYSDADLTTPVNSTGYGAYTSGGTWKRIIPKSSTYTLTVTYALTYAAA